MFVLQYTSMTVDFVGLNDITVTSSYLLAVVVEHFVL